jgi:transposase
VAIVTVGIDLAKNVFAVHGVDATGRAVLVRPSVTRAKLPELVASLPPWLIGMEACSGSAAPQHGAVAAVARICVSVFSFSRAGSLLRRRRQLSRARRT